MFERNPRQRIVLFAGMAAAAVLVAAALSANQSLQSATAQTEDEEAQPSTLSTTGTATTQVQPDKFRVTASVVTNATSAQDAASENAQIMDDVIADLQALGIEEEQIGTSNYVLYPVYQDKPPAEVCIQVYPPPPECLGGVITGYRVSNTVSVTLDVNGTVTAGSVIDAAVEAGANTVEGVTFFISEEMQQEVRDGLIEEAVANARHRADIAAGAVGTQVTGVQSVTINDVQFPIFPRGPEAVGDAGTPILPGEQQVASSVSITFYIDNTVEAGAG